MVAIGHVVSSPSEEDSAEVVALVERAQSGDESSWRMIVSKFHGTLLRAATVWGLDNAAASDVVQQTWLAAYRNLGALRNAAALGGWLRTILRYECLKEVKHRRRETPSRDVEVGADRRMFLCCEPQPPETTVLRLEEEELLQVARERLSQRDQDLLALIMDEPTPVYSEISRQLGMPVGSIGPTRGRCLARFRRELEQLGIDGF